MRSSGEDGDRTTTTKICQSSIYLYINQYQYTYIKDEINMTYQVPKSQTPSEYMIKKMMKKNVTKKNVM